jgi:hypothetical protein
LMPPAFVYCDTTLNPHSLHHLRYRIKNLIRFRPEITYLQNQETVTQKYLPTLLVTVSSVCVIF